MTRATLAHARPRGSVAPPSLGDLAALHPGITGRLAEAIASGTAERVPASAPHP